MIRCEGLQWGPPGRPLTPPLDLHLAAGSLTAVIGHNGCGKSSLLKPSIHRKDRSGLQHRP